jgi:transposase
MVEAMCWVLRTGCPWRDLPAGCGPWSSVYTRWRRWVARGLWARVLRTFARKARGTLRFVDCSHIKLHQDAANPAGGQSAQAIGKTRGGLNSKLAAAVDLHGRVVAMLVDCGQRNDQRVVDPLLTSLRGRRLVADKGFDADAFARRLRALRIRVCIPARRGRRHPLPFHRAFYRKRHRVENCFQRLKRFRRISTRYEKLASTFLAFIQLAAVLDWLRFRV